jgi:hypothetical protein
MSHPTRRGPDRTIILRIPRVAPLAQAIDLAAVRAGQTPPEFIKSTLAAACLPAAAPAEPRRITREAA